MSDLSLPWQPHLDTCLAQMLTAMAVPAWLHREGAPLLSNAPLQRLYGGDAADLPAHLALVIEQDRETLDEATRECLQGSGEPPAHSMQLLTRNGSQRPVELTLRRVLAAGEPAALVTCQDLSDFQHVHGRLLSMSNLLRQIVDGAPVASYVIDSNHRVTHWNGACELLTGLPADTMIGTTDHWKPFFAERRPLLADLIADQGTPGEQFDGIAVRPSALATDAVEQERLFEGMTAEGRWILTTVAPLRGPLGESMGAIVTLQDVTERRRTEAELHRQLESMVAKRSAELASHARLMDALIDNAPFGVVYTVNHRVVRANQRMNQIFGDGEVDDDSGTGQDSGGAFHMSPQDARCLRRLASPRFAADESLHHEMWMQHRDGHPLWVQINAFPVEFSDDTTGAWWMLQDRTEMREAQQALAARFDELKATNQKLEQAQNQLLQADKMASIGQLAAGVAHEINNPVGFVSSNLHTLRQYVESLLSLVDAQALVLKQPDDEQARAGLKRAAKAAELDYLKEDLPELLDESADGLARVKKIVQDLKDFSRVDQADWQQADINAGLESTLNVVRNEVKYKCEVVKALTPLPLVTCLAGQINQVFMNLIVNASHAIAEHGTITLRSGHEGRWAWVEVQDTGCGMSDEVRRRIFEPFFTTKDVGKGTGLGLSLSFSIVKRHEGEIQVRSTPGLGSRFRVWLPVHGPEAVSGQSTGPAPQMD